MQLFAGPMMNFILAIIIFIIIGLYQGVPSERALIGEVLPDSPAAQAGIVSGDEVVEIDGKKVTDWTSFTNVIRASANKEIDLIVLRDGKIEHLLVTPK